MPFEVYPVQGMTNNFSNPRREGDVAKDIAKVYQAAAEKGGRVVGQHEIEAAQTRKAVSNFLYLVIETPEATATPAERESVDVSPKPKYRDPLSEAVGYDVTSRAAKFELVEQFPATLPPVPRPPQSV